MTATINEVKSPNNPPETIIDRTPQEPFISPLQRYIEENCKRCDFWKGKCRLDDQNGISRMALCIALYPYSTFLKDPREVIAEIEKQLKQGEM